MTGHTVNQRRAIAHFLKMHPHLKPALGVAGLTVGFQDRVTGEHFDKSLQHLEMSYNNFIKAKAETRKKMEKGLSNHGRKPEHKSKRVRSSGAGTQSAFTGDGWG